MTVRIDAEAFSDERFEVLAALCHLADADHARGKLARLWRQCTVLYAYVLPESVVRAVLGHQGPEALCEAGLGERVEEGIRMRGTLGRIEWLHDLRERSRRGGEATRKKYQEPAGQPHSQPNGQPHGSLEGPTASPVAGLQASPEPGPLTLTLTPTPINGNSEEELRIKNRPAGRPKGSRKIEPTESELASVATVLGKLTGHNGVRYSGTPAHTRLIVSRLREGLSEMDLRVVVYYCAVAKGMEWATSPEMVRFLRPETLFGPNTIARYLDAARSWYATLGKAD
jgi:uncharacterized phage protein (TIGR02220 family)